MKYKFKIKRVRDFHAAMKAMRSYRAERGEEDTDKDVRTILVLLGHGKSDEDED